MLLEKVGGHMNLEYLLECPQCKRVTWDRTKWYSTTEIKNYEWLRNNDLILTSYCPPCGQEYLIPYGLLGVKL